MDLILWRHAEAVDQANEDLEIDLARPLTPKGQKQAARMAEWLNRVLPDSTRVLVSPALRCQQTAQALQRKFQTREEIGPHGGPVELLRVAGWPNKRAPVLVVGHQPALGQVAAALLAGQDDAGTAPSWSVRKGSIWWLRRRDRESGPEVVLMTVRAADRI